RGDGRALLPRAGGESAHAGVGLHARHRALVHADRALDRHLPGAGHPRHRDRVQPRRGRAPRPARPAAPRADLTRTVGGEDTMGTKRLFGGVAIVTGAAHGIGRAISVELAREGATVWACDVLERELGETRRAAAERGEAACRAAVVDVTDPARVAAF